jgi:hypothetical protein
VEINGSETQVGPLSSEEALQDIDQVKRFEKQVQNCHRWKTSFEEGAYATNFINQFKGRTYILRRIIGFFFYSKNEQEAVCPHLDLVALFTLKILNEL